MKSIPQHTTRTVLLVAALAATLAHAAVKPEEAAQLGTTLTPFGAEKAGNKEGTIPPWTGGVTTPPPGYKSGARNADPFAADKILYTVTAKNVDQYADKLSEGQIAMLKKYPDTYRIDVYPTRRTAAAPQWVYDEVRKNATRGEIVEGSINPYPKGTYGPIPFPIPKTGIEVIWNHLLGWHGGAYRQRFQAWLTTEAGQHILTAETINDVQPPYEVPKGSPETWNQRYLEIKQVNQGPAIRVGEGIVGLVNVDDAKSQAWVYLTGQRRVRKLPNASGDTPNATTAGVMTFDDIGVFFAQPGQFNWKLVGKKELLIPYNTNRINLPASVKDVMGARHLNPQHVRWELHRVWVLETTLKEGKRNIAPRGRYYIDEDSWTAALGDRWDSKGQLWKTMWAMPMLFPEGPAIGVVLFGFNDLISGAAFANGLTNFDEAILRESMPFRPDQYFTPESLVSDQLR